MSKFGFLSTNAARTRQRVDVEFVYKHSFCANRLADPPRPQQSTFRLNGETISSPGAAAAAFKKGPFMYQVRSGSRSDNPVAYCRTEDDLYVLQDRLANGRMVVMRHLRPDPLPPAPPIYVEQRYASSWW